jgi:asparaginyl-tRNA synthetase
MKQNKDGKTVASFDILAPEVGEIIGGSQREEILETLEARMEELKLPK